MYIQCISIYLIYIHVHTCTCARTVYGLNLFFKYCTCLFLIYQDTSENEEERADFQILSTDNLILVGKADDEISNVEVHG